MNYVEAFFTSTAVKRFAWTTLAGFMGLVVIYLGNFDYWWIPLITALIAGITKSINSNAK